MKNNYWCFGFGSCISGIGTEICLDIGYLWSRRKSSRINKFLTENPFQPERVFQYLFLKILQNLRK